MTTRFHIDLTHPGATHRLRGEWFFGTAGLRHLALVAAGGVALVLLVGLGGVLPRYLSYSNDLNAVAKLRQEVKGTALELDTLRTNLRELSAEARRQVRWSEVLPAVSQRLPDPLKVERIALSRGGAAQPVPGGPAPNELALQIDATAPVVPGANGLIDVANFMGALAQDPTIARQFQLRTWEARPGRQQEGPALLHITIGFVEKRS